MHDNHDRLTDLLVKKNTGLDDSFDQNKNCSWNSLVVCACVLVLVTKSISFFDSFEWMNEIPREPVRLRLVVVPSFPRLR